MSAIAVAVLAYGLLLALWKPHPRSVSITAGENGRLLVHIQDRHSKRVHPMPANLFKQPGTPSLISFLGQGRSITLTTKFDSGEEVSTKIPDWAAPLIAHELWKLSPGALR